MKYIDVNSTPMRMGTRPNKHVHAHTQTNTDTGAYIHTIIHEHIYVFLTHAFTHQQANTYVKYTTYLLQPFCFVLRGSHGTETEDGNG